MTGKHFEDFVLGEVFQHSARRTVTETDNVLFTTLTMNPQPLHLDEEYAKASIYGRRIVNSVFTLGLVAGIHVADLTLGTTLGNLGFKDVTFPKPVYIGDTIRVETQVLATRESRSRANAGIVELEHRAINQDDVVVCVLRRSALMLRRTPAAM
jgi:acyl dehydratase